MAHSVCPLFHYSHDRGELYLVPSRGMQSHLFIFILLTTLQSPRWLVLRSRHDDAARSLRRLRKLETSDAQLIAELDELETATAENPPKIRSIEIFKGTHLRRTMISCMVNFFQQATGQSFSSQYGTLFVKGLGGVDAFTINMINNAMNVIGILICLLLSDRLGRR